MRGGQFPQCLDLDTAGTHGLFFAVVGFGALEKSVHFRTRNHHPAQLGYHFDFSGINLPVAPSVVPSEQGRKFRWRKNNFFWRRKWRKWRTHSILLVVAWDLPALLGRISASFCGLWLVFPSFLHFQ